MIDLRRSTREQRRAAVWVRPDIAAELTDLRGRLPGAQGVLLCTVDGLVVAHDLAAGRVTDVATAVAALAAQARATSAALGRGDVLETVCRTTAGCLAVFQAGPFTALAVLLAPGGTLGRLHLEARRSAATLAGLLAGGEPAGEEPR